MALFHVSSSRNRDSIAAYGLDSARMSGALGIAGSVAPEVAGVFLADCEDEVKFFVRMNSSGGPVDVWRVDGIELSSLLESPEGFSYYPGTIGVERVTLVQAGVSLPAADG